MAKKQIRDVAWVIPTKKKPIAYSSNDVSFCIELYVSILNEQGIRCTPYSLLEYFTENKLVGLYEEKRILQAYIDSGFGDIEFQISERGFITIERVKR